MHASPGDMHESPARSWPVAFAGPYHAPQGKDFPPHQHRTWEFIYYRTGKIACPVGDAMYESQPGMLLLTPPETIHAEYAHTAYSNYYIGVDAPADMPWPRRCFDDTERTFGTLFGAIVREWRSDACDRDDLLCLLMNQLDILLRRQRVQQPLSEAELSVRAAERLIEERCVASLTIGSVAAEIGVAPSTLRAQFVRLRGRTPRSYLHALRMERALAMLRNSNLSIEEVAGLCGYDSASHLSRHVKRATGRSPGTLRRP
jgi:AraC-like DNA-binding protein